jgi:hypothetical protein
MTKIIDFSKESEFFQNLTSIYIQLSSVYPNDLTFMNPDEPIDCHEILDFCVHHAECGENVYLIGFPRQVEVLKRPKTLFFMKKWCELMDVTDVDHAMIVNIRNRNTYDLERLSETMTHINKHFRSGVNFSFQN